MTLCRGHAAGWYGLDLIWLRGSWPEPGVLLQYPRAGKSFLMVGTVEADRARYQELR